MTQTNAFIGRTVEPSDTDLTAALGASRTLWDDVVACVTALGVDDRDWNSYSPKTGWALRLRRKGRNIVYLSPLDGCFVASFILGDRAIEAARSSVLPPEVLENINGSKRYMEGTGVRIDVHTPGDIAVVIQLAAIKLAH